MRKVTIIGAGNVGATIAYALAIEGVANEILIIDIRKDKADGEAMDIAQGSPFFPGAPRIYSGDYADAVDSDIVIITSGVARKPGQTRLELAQTNVNIMKSVAEQISRYAPNAIYVVVANPVDVMTYALHKFTNIPEKHIIGSGTILDTARLRSRLSDIFDVSQQNVHAHIFGEHGDSSFVPWSIATLSSVPLEDYRAALEGTENAVAPLDHNEIEEFVRTSGAQIIKNKGATFYAVAISAVHICKCIFSGNETTLTVSAMMHGEYGIEDVCLSVLALVGEDGIKTTVPVKLTDEEVAKLQNSAKCLRAVIDNVNL